MTSLADLSHHLELAHHELAEHRVSVEKIQADFQEAKREMRLRSRYQREKAPMLHNIGRVAQIKANANSYYEVE
ncbi:hypothetical protein Clacol_010107 [Clathrus columnatus]|uniref:Uncharacterized protein n=1 Tax=Clathrus columnatus TaxID=1419009 RepID=A0AAV5ARQ4_9AGAM|nr:hypothetical protein Clacol_010107 [Clathrus columnatus]